MVEQQEKKAMNPNMQKARAVAAANRAARQAAEAAKHQVEEKKQVAHTPTEQDIVKSQIEERARQREEADKPVEEVVEAVKVVESVEPTRIVPELIILPGGKCAAKLGGRILVRGNREKVKHYIDQF